MDTIKSKTRRGEVFYSRIVPIWYGAAAILAVAFDLYELDAIFSINTLSYLVVFPCILYPAIIAIWNLIITYSERRKLKDVFDVKNKVELVVLAAALICLIIFIKCFLYEKDYALYEYKLKGIECAVMVSVGYLLQTARKFIYFSGQRDNPLRITLPISIVVMASVIDLLNIMNMKGEMVNLKNVGIVKNIYISIVINLMLLIFISLLFGEISEDIEDQEGSNPTLIIPSLLLIIIAISWSIGFGIFYFSIPKDGRLVRLGLKFLSSWGSQSTKSFK